MKINKMLYKLDQQGFFLDYEDVEVEFNPETKDITNIPEGYAPFGWAQQSPKQRWFRPKFIDGKWVESLTQEEIQEHDKKLEIESKSKEELEIEQLKIAMAELTVLAQNNITGGM